MSNNSGTINLVYFSKFLHYFIYNNYEGEVTYRGLYQLPYYISQRNLIDFFDSILIAKVKPQKNDSKSFLRNLAKEWDEERDNPEKYVTDQLMEFVNNKYEDHISIRKSFNMLSYFEVLDKTFEITAEQYIDDLIKPFLNLYLKMSQYSYWLGESKSIRTFPEDVYDDQKIIDGCVIMFNLFDGAVMLDGKDMMPIELEFDSHFNSWETALSSLLSKIDPIILNTQLDMYLSIIQLYKEYYWSVKDEDMKKTKGGQSNIFEAVVLTEIYKELKELKETRGIEIEIIEMDLENEPMIYTATRDQWVNALRSDLVDVLNIIYKARGHHKRLKKNDSPETIRALAMKVEKENDKIDEKITKYKNYLT